MANGYLGKISAIVSANTSDFDGKLSKSAKSVSAFASQVQGNLTSASRQAARALEGIYTPIQRFERSLQAAGTMKLSFKGFPGMIKDLDSLQQRMNSALSKRQVDIILKTTGMQSIDQVREKLYGLKSKDVELIARVGGLDKLKELQGKIAVDVDVSTAQTRVAELTATANAAKERLDALGSEQVTVNVGAAGIDSLRASLDEARAAAGRFMGGEFLGDKSLAKAISGIATELVRVEGELAKAKAAKDTLETMSTGPRAKPADLNAANARLADVSGQQQELSKKLAQLEKYRDTIKQLQREIKQAESSTGTPASGEDRAKAYKEMEAAQRAAARAAKDLQKQVAARYGIDVDLTSLDSLVKRATDAGSVIGNLDELIDALGKSDFDAAADSMRKMQSASAQIYQPLKASVEKLSGLAVEMQTAYHDALKVVQVDVEQLSASIEKVGEDGPSPELGAFFDQVQSKAENATKSIDRLTEVSQRLGQLKTGKEFAFEQPGLNEAITKSTDIGNRASALPAEALRTNPAIAQSLVEIRRLANEAGAAYAKFLAVRDQGLPTGDAQAELDAVVAKLLDMQGVAEKEIRVHLDTAEAQKEADRLREKVQSLKQNVAFTVTGKVQNFEQARAEVGRLQSELGKLDATQRAPIARKVVALGKLVESGDVSSLEAIRDLIDRIDRAIGRKRRIAIENEQAKKAAAEVEASLAKIKDSIAFTVTGKVQNVEQARAELARIQSDVDKLTESQKISIAPKLQAVGELVAPNEIKNLEQVRQLLAELAQEAGTSIKVNLDTAEAQKEADRLREKVQSLKQNVAFTVTGKVQNFEQARAEVGRLQSELGKLDATQRAPIARKVVALGKLVESGDVSSLEAIRDLIDRIDRAIGRKRRIAIENEQAKKAAAEVEASLAKIKDSIAFTVTGKVQNVEQARAELARIQSDVDKLTESQKIAIAPKLQAVGELVAPNEIKNLEQVRQLLAELAQEAGTSIKVNLDTAEAQKEADRLREKVQSLKQNVAFTVTGKVQNFEQARAEVGRLQSELGKLDASQRAPIARKVLALGKLVESGDVSSLEAVRDLIDRIDRAIGRKRRIAIENEQAKKAAAEVEASLANIKDSIAFTVTGKVQNVEQARAELARIQSDVDKLTESQKIAIAPKLQELGKLVADGEITSLEKVRSLIDQIRAEAGSAIQINLSTAEADKKANDLKARLDALRGDVTFAVTGGFSNADQIEAEVSQAIADIGKLEAAQKSAFGQRATFVIDLLGQGKIQDAAIEAKNLRADLEQQISVNITTADAQKAADALKAKFDLLREENAYIVTGRPQNMQQAESREASLKGEIGGLKGSQRRRIQPLLEDAALARQAGDLAGYANILDRIELKITKAKRFNVTTADAKKKTDDLKASIDGLKEDADFRFTGLPQNQAQAKSEIGRIIGKTDGLDPAALARVTAAKDAAIAGLGNADFGGPLIKVFGDLVEKEVQAKKAADDLTAAMNAIGDAANPSAPIDILKKNLAEAKAAVAKLEGPMKAVGEKNIAKIETFVGANAGNDAAARLAGLRAGQLRDAAVAAAPPPKPPKIPADPLGADFGTAERSIAALQSDVISLQNNLEKLPTPLQAQFIPAINKVRAAFRGITPSSTAAEIDAVVKKAAGLERVLTRAQQASKIGGTLGDALNNAAFTRTEKQIGFIRAKLLEVGAAASGPVADAFNKYSAFVSDAAKKGTLGFAATKEQADQLAEKIGEAALAAGLFKNKAEAAAFVKGVGDVGRAGADKFALALNQAAFAVDDFLSSTGGLEFKLRAISNNVTQLAFILGGTKGLFIGLGAVIGGQLALGLIKWANNGQTAEDQTKSLNDALARQKSLVEGLAEAFKSLGDSMSRGTFSEAGEKANEFNRQIKDIRRKQEEIVRNSIADLDPEVIKERAEQKKLQRKIEASTDVGQITGLRAQMEASKRREQAAAERAASAPSPTTEDVKGGIKQAFDAMASAAFRDATRFIPDAAVGMAAAEPFRAKARSVQEAGSVAEARGQIKAAIDELSTQVEGGFLAPSQAAAASESIRRLTLLLNSLDAPLAREINAAANAIAEASRAPAEQIRQAQEEVAQAIELGLPGARMFASELDKNAEQLQEAFRKLKEAQEGKDGTGRPLSDEEKKSRLDAASADINALNARRREMAAQADAFAYERIVDPQRQIDARLGRARSNLGSAGLEDGRIARRMREIEAEREQIRRRAELPEFQTPEMRRGLQDAEQALNEEAAAIEAATIAVKIFAAELNKAAEEVSGNLNSAQQRADEARRADLANSTPATRAARRQAEADLEAQRAVERKAQEEIAVERDRLEDIQRPQQERLQEIDEELKSGRTKQEEERKRLNEERAAVAADINNQNSAAIADVERARKRDEAAQAAARVNADTFDAARGLGIDTTGMGEEEVKAAIRRAGRSDVADELDRRRTEANAAMRSAGFSESDLRGPDFWAAVNRAGEELAAALERQAQVANEGAARLAEIDAQIAAVPTNDSERREELIRERETLTNQMEDDARRSQRRVDAARDASTAEEEFQKSAARGRELGMTEREKDKEKAAAIGADIAARASQIDNDGERERFINDATRNAFKEAAPMLFSMDEQFKNAMREPTRARIEATDINSQQGQSELNRLLRGDDDAKNQNLEVLNKQLGKLEEIKQAVIANTGQVVN